MIEKLIPLFDVLQKEATSTKEAFLKSLDENKDLIPLAYTTIIQECNTPNQVFAEQLNGLKQTLIRKIYRQQMKNINDTQQTITEVIGNDGTNGKMAGIKRVEHCADFLVRMFAELLPK